ncbi:MAG: hypothetical protein Fur002_10420 [Anaerolineales bacterium]
MNELMIALQITALGMGLVFGAIVLLWLMMIALVKFTAEPNSAADAPQAESSATEISPAAVAALAVAAALAEQAAAARALPEPPTALVSAWQLAMRMRQSSEKGSFRRH